MKPFMGQWIARVLVAVCAISLMAPGCASTKNVMNKATFGIIGGSQGPDEQSSEAKETKAERKAREKEEKQQREAEKRAAKDEERARKAAAKEEKQSEEKPGLMSRMTFGLVGGDKQSEADKQVAADTKAAKKEQRRQDKEAREQEKRDAKAAKRQQEQEEEARKKEEKLAAKEEKAREKDAAKSELSHAQPTEPPDASASSAAPVHEQPKEKRTLMSRMTFGLVGGKKSDQADESEAPGQSDTSAASAESTAPTPPTSEGPTKEAQKAAKRAEKEQRESEKQAKKDAERAEKEQQKQSKAEAEQVAETATDDEPKEKRTLMSRMTFGLVGGKKSDKSETSEPSDTANTPTDAAAATEPVDPALPPEQLAMAAPRDVQYDVQPASALDGETQKLAKMPFKTTFDLSTKSATGKGQATASRETYSKNGYGITDLGDVRIAVQGMTFDGESRAGGVIISSDERLPAAGKAGTGNSAFVYEYAKGVTAVQFGTVNFTIANSVINIGGKSVPIGQGKKLIVLDGQGNVIGAYSAE